jgi:hypothetical protein
MGDKKGDLRSPFFIVCCLFAVIQHMVNRTFDFIIRAGRAHTFWRHGVKTL